MTRIFIGIVAAMALVLGLQTWRLSNAQEDVATLEGNQARLEKTLTIAKESYEAMEANKNIEIQLLSTRASEREQHIKSLSEQNKQLAAVTDDSGCLDSRMPDQLVRLLNDGEGDYSAHTHSSAPPVGANAQLPEAEIDGGDVSGRYRIRDGPRD